MDIGLVFNKVLRIIGVGVQERVHDINVELKCDVSVMALLQPKV